MNHRTHSAEHSPSNTTMEDCSYLPLHSAACFDHTAETAATRSKQQFPSSSVLPYPFQEVPFISGAAFGFFIQIVAIYSGALSLLLAESGQDPATILSLTASFLARIDLLAYDVIWVVFTWVQFRQDCVWRCKSVFHVGINALVGLVIGSFASWLLINRAMNFPIATNRFALTLIFDLILCYFMLVWNDWEDKERDDDDDNNCEVEADEKKELERFLVVVV
jgi:hypothetical protein